MEAVTAMVLWATGLFVLYWVVRAAVKGGILDADRILERQRSVPPVVDRTDPDSPS